MAEEQTGQERTEQPTERRLQEARKKGQVPRSKELNTMLSLILASLALLVLGGNISQTSCRLAWKASRYPASWLSMPAQLPVPIYVHGLAGSAGAVAVYGGDAGFGICRSADDGGWSFSLETISFKFEKLNPIKGLARIFR